MNKKYIIGLLAFGMMACQSEKKESLEDVLASNDLVKIKAYKKNINADVATLKAKMDSLDKSIKKLDTIHKLPLVTTIQVQEELFSHYIELQGTVKTEKDMFIFPEFPGILTKVNVKEGQYVSKGQTLAYIDKGNIPQQISQMEVQLALAKTTYLKRSRLWKQKIGSEIEYLNAKATYQAQAKAIEATRKTLDKTLVKAPFSGIIEDVIIQQGTVVQPGMQIMRIINANSLQITSQVPEKYLKNIRKGTSVRVEFPVLGETIATNVSKTSNTINPQNRTFETTINIGNKGGLIKPNLTARLYFNDYNNTQALMVPQRVISENSEGKQFVFVAKPTAKTKEFKAFKVFVKTANTKGDKIEITEGIYPQDLILDEGAKNVKNNQLVKVIKY